MKTKVVVITSDSEAEYKIGQTGYIDGYLMGAFHIPHAVVVISEHITLIPLNHLRVTHQNHKV